MIRRNDGSFTERKVLRIMELDNKGLGFIEECNLLKKLIRNDIRFTGCTYRRFTKRIKEASDIISLNEEKIGFKDQETYIEDDDNPKIEVWKWVLVVQWWRIIFKYKRNLIDEKEKENLENKKR